jgi:GTP cyclohydrolase IA
MIKVTRNEAEEAVKTLLAYIGEDQNREGLLDTPRRVVESFSEHFAGYLQNPEDILSTTFAEVEGYNEIILLKNIGFSSHCEHHMSPIIGHATIAYFPDKRIVGISKLARIVDVFAKRLQIQEKMTSQIAGVINEILMPKGVAVIIEATHHCMVTRGIKKDNTMLKTSTMMGCFRDDINLRKELFNLIRG